MAQQQSSGGFLHWLVAGSAGLVAVFSTTWLVAPGGSSDKPASRPVVLGAQEVLSDAAEEQHRALRMRGPLYDFFGIEPQAPPTKTPSRNSSNIS
jgi:hypothetical protein